MNCLLSNANREDCTIAEVFEYMKKNPDRNIGWALYWTNDAKFIMKDITYNESLNVEKDYMAVRFFPYGYNSDRDIDVINNLTGLEKFQ
jgi:hypothetical protein